MVESLYLNNRMFMVFLLSDAFIMGNGHFRLNHKRNDRKPLEFIENRCTHCALRLVLTSHRKSFQTFVNIKKSSKLNRISVPTVRGLNRLAST